MICKYLKRFESSQLLIWISVLFLYSHVMAQTHTVTINEGYGSGMFASADTVDIYAREEKLTEVFDHWSGDTSWLDDPSEWHSKLIVPNKNINLTANFKSLPLNAQMNFERLQGRDTLKPVLYYFPTNPLATKALVWILHGTGGYYLTIPQEVDGMSAIKRLIANGFAVAVTECDEASYKVDFNGDGGLRWNYNPSRETNPDIINMIMFMDYFKSKGWMRSDLPVFGWGFSAGGYFTLLDGPILNFKKGVSFSGVSAKKVGELSVMPSFWAMGENDYHPDVGKEGNDTARMSYEKMIDRGVCAKYILHGPSPFYPEFFRRIPGVDSALSTGIYIDMRRAGAINNKNYLALLGDQLRLKVIANPTLYPFLTSLTQEQADELEKQMVIMNGGHTFHSHYTGKVLRFFEEECGGLSNVKQVDDLKQNIQLFPNPVSNEVRLRASQMQGKKILLRIYSITGQMVFETKYSDFPESVLLDIESIPKGFHTILLVDQEGNKEGTVFIKE